MSNPSSISSRVRRLADWPGCWSAICGCPEWGLCRALQGYDIRARGTDPRPNAPPPACCVGLERSSVLGDSAAITVYWSEG
eukprot:998932-Prymnesium_polylepis.1